MSDKPLSKYEQVRALRERAYDAAKAKEEERNTLRKRKIESRPESPQPVAKKKRGRPPKVRT
jgi:hypothetical protein